MDLKKTLSEQIYEILRNDIVTQAIPCGSKLTLKILQERFHVSSTPIREALTRLAEEQLASYYSNIGVSVVSLDETDVREIYQFMGDLDSLAVNYASLCPDQKPILRELAGNLAGMDACALSSPDWQTTPCTTSASPTGRCCPTTWKPLSTAIPTAPTSRPPATCAARCPSWPTSMKNRPLSRT